MVRFFILLLAVWIVACKPSDGDWAELKVQLESMRFDDQLHRSQMDSVGKRFGWYSSEMMALLNAQRNADSINMAKVEEIIDDFGYPPRTKVGEEAETIFLIINHSPDTVITEYYEVIVEAAGKGDLPKDQVALFQDRVLMLRKQPQEFGSQLWIESKMDQKTGEQYDSLFLWEIRDKQNVNNRRLEVGLDSLESYLKRLDIDPVKGYALRKKG